MKIVCFLFDNNTGGPTVRARMVYRQMVAEGDSPRVAFPQPGPATAYIEEAEIPADIIGIDKPVLPRKIGPFLRFALRAPINIIRIRRYLRRERPDVVHVNGAYDLFPALAARMSGIPVVWHLNDTVFGPRLSRMLGRMVRSLATVVVTAANRVAEHYGVTGADPIIIHAPVDVDRFAARDPEHLPGPAPKIGLVGNWNWIKGQDRFVDVIAQLRADGRPVEGEMVGRFLDSQTDFWEPIVARIENDPDLDAAIHRRGFVADTPGALRGMDLLLLTSHSEASPICVLEAMSTGVPQVVFDVGGVREMLGEGDEAAGIIVPPGDVAAMTSAVARILDDPALYRRLATNGMQRARAHFSVEACVRRHRRAYDAATAPR